MAVAGCIFLGLNATLESPQKLATEAKTQERVEQLAQINRQLYTVSNHLTELSNQQERIFQNLLPAQHISSSKASTTTDFPFPTRMAGIPRASLDELLTDLQQRVHRLAHRTWVEQNHANQRRQWLRQWPSVLPAEGVIASGYGTRYHPILNKEHLHAGIDIDLPIGTPVMATGDGVVTAADTLNGYGKHVKILHPQTGHVTLYAHLSHIPLNLQQGSFIERGRTIGYSGASGRVTGPHLHYEVRQANGHPLNPLSFLVPPSSRASHINQALSLDLPTLRPLSSPNSSPRWQPVSYPQ